LRGNDENGPAEIPDRGHSALEAVGCARIEQCVEQRPQHDADARLLRDMQAPYDQLMARVPVRVDAKEKKAKKTHAIFRVRIGGPHSKYERQYGRPQLLFFGVLRVRNLTYRTGDRGYLPASRVIRQVVFQCLSGSFILSRVLECDEVTDVSQA
jgi:hypothetical protein